MVAVELLLMVDVVTLKVADEAVAATFTEAGTVRVVLEFERVTLTPPVGAAWLRLTVQMLEEFGPILLGLHDKEDTATDADGTKSTVVFTELPL
jgi:hypothetical protein